jgi:hypothetical protein
MIRGTIVRIGDRCDTDLSPTLATLDCMSSRRGTVMCALPRVTVVTTEYQSDSSSKRPRSSVVSAARPPTPTSPTWVSDSGRGLQGLRAFRGAPTAPLDPVFTV